MICNNLTNCVDFVMSKTGNACRNQINCIECADTRSNVKCEENGKIYNLENPNREFVILYSVDGGVIKEDVSVPPNTCKCDYMYVIGEKGVILTELKGVNVRHAIEQISGTMDIYKDFLSKQNAVYGRVVVSSSTPKLSATPYYTKLQMKLKRMKGNLKVKERKFSESVEKLAIE